LVAKASRTTVSYGTKGQNGQRLVAKASRTTVSYGTKANIVRYEVIVMGRRFGTVSSWAIGSRVILGKEVRTMSSWAKGQDRVILVSRVILGNRSGPCHLGHHHRTVQAKGRSRASWTTSNQGTESNTGKGLVLYVSYGSRPIWQKLVARHRGPLAIICMVWITKTQRPIWAKIGRKGIADQGNHITNNHGTKAMLGKGSNHKSSEWPVQSGESNLGTMAGGAG
jgi:hypothetical protein